jgi:diguanylate cyclase (GGDEF)-like protein
MRTLLWNLAILGVLLLSVASLVVAFRAASGWLHDRARIGITLFCAAAVAAAAATAVWDGFAGRPAGLLGWLRLLPVAALPVIVIALLRALRRHDALRVTMAREAPFNRATGLANRPLFQRQIVPVLARCRREGSPAIMLAVGIDGFAAIRDQHGPVVAAGMLRTLGEILGEATRGGDLSGHVEPDLLGALLPDATGDAAESVAARLRRLAAERMIDVTMTGRRVTMSIGIAMVGDGVEAAVLEEAISTAVAACRQKASEGGDGIRLATIPPVRSAPLAG